NRRAVFEMRRPGMTDDFLANEVHAAQEAGDQILSEDASPPINDELQLSFQRIRRSQRRRAQNINEALAGFPSRAQRSNLKQKTFETADKLNIIIYLTQRRFIEQFEISMKGRILIGVVDQQKFFDGILPLFFVFDGNVFRGGDFTAVDGCRRKLIHKTDEDEIRLPAEGREQMQGGSGHDPVILLEIMMHRDAQGLVN